MLYHFALLLPSMVCLFWAIFLICNVKENRKSQHILAIGAFLTSFTYFNLAYYIDGVKDFTTYYILDILDPAFFIPPVMYLYFKSLTNEKRFGWKDYLWFLPSVVTEVVLFSSYMLMGEENAVMYSQDLLTYGTLLPKYTDIAYKLHYLFSTTIYYGIAFLLSIGVCFYALVGIIRYHYRLRDFYSSLDDKSLNRIYSLLISFTIATLIGVVLFYLNRDFFLGHRIANLFIFIALAAFYFFLCYTGYRIRYTVEDLASDLERADLESANDVLSADGDDFEYLEFDDKSGKYEHLAIKFKKLIDEEKIFLQSSLRADEVAAMLHSNRTYISRMIHEEFNSNFSDYINEQRIKYSKEFMLLHPSMRMNEVAEKSGFVNASSYSRTFKQFTGKSPKVWLQDTYYGIVS